MEDGQTNDDPQAADFFDDATSDDGDSSFLAKGNPETALKHGSLNSETLPEEELIKPSTDPTRRQPPPRPLQPSARNSGASQLHEPIVAEGIYPEENPIAAAEWGTQPTQNDTLVDNRLSQTASKHLSFPPGAVQSLLGANKYEQVANIHAMTLEYLLRSDENEETALAQLEDPQEDTVPAKAKRRVGFVPPPISTSPKKLNEEDIVRTPYPFGIRKSFLRQSRINMKDIPREAILVLSLRRHPNRKALRISELKIPASPDSVPVVAVTTADPSTSKENVSSSEPGQSEKHFETLDFDDAHFFRSLCAAYTRLAGPLRWFSARGLHHIEVSHSDDHGAGSFSCPHELPRSPIKVISQGLSDSFSKASLMSHYRAPNKGKGQYMWVHWAHRIASTPAHLLPPAPVPLGDSPGVPSTASGAASAQPSATNPRWDEERRVWNRSECVPGLEFVEDWVPWRVAVAVIAVLVVSILTTLLWTLLGVSGFRNNWRVMDNMTAERIIPGFAIGGLIWAVGMTLVVLWLCLSWLIE
jgi:hypothetical protein